MPSRCEPTRELRELLIKRTFLGDSAPNEREKNFAPVRHPLQFARTGVVHTKWCASHEFGGLKMLRLDARRVRELPTTRKCRRQLRAVLLTNSPARYRREEDGASHVWYCGSLVWSDILRTSAQGGYRQ